MREKFEINKSDEKYMSSIGKGLQKKYASKPKANPFAESYKAKNAKVHKEWAGKKAKISALRSKIGNGNSHFSRKSYSHE